MHEFLQFLFLGLVGGSAIAAIAVGVVITYRASGVINFAAGAFALLPAYWFNTLRVDGDLVLPVGQVHIGDPGVVGAFAIALVLAGVTGLLVYLLVIKPLRNAPSLAQVAATVGVMIGLQALTVLRFGSGVQAAESVLAAGSTEVFGVSVPTANLEVAALVLVVAAALTAFYRFTKFGLVTRAAAENERNSAFLGYTPTRYAATNWVIASVVAGLFGILVAPISSLNATTMVVIIVPALGAALVARFTSIWLAAVAGLLIGIFQSEILKLQTVLEWLPEQGLAEALPLLVIVVAMVVVGGRIPSRGTALQRRLPVAAMPRHVGRSALVGAGIAVAALLLLQGQYRAALISTGVTGIIGLSVVLITGYVGQISLAQMTFAGVAGIVLSKLSINLGIPFPLAPFLGASAAAAVGVLLGLPALRVRGVQLAVVTMGAAVAISALVFNNSSVAGYGGAPVPDAHLFGLDLAIGSAGSGYPRVEFGIFVFAVFIALAVLLANLRRSATGRRMLAVRFNERAAASLGVNVEATKLVAFGASAFIAGAGGCLLGYQNGVISQESVTVLVSVSLLTFVYIGGIGSIFGTLFAGALATTGLISVALDDLFPGLNEYIVLIGAIGVIVTAIANPDGVAPKVQESLRGLLGRAARQ